VYLTNILSSCKQLHAVRPLTRKQLRLNVNPANTKALEGVLPALLHTNKAVMAPASVSISGVKQYVRDNLATSQYRHNGGKHLDDPLTLRPLSLPVFNSFEDDRKLAGVLAIMEAAVYSYPSSFRLGNCVYTRKLV
jgi:hypothetical protein